jgi:histidine triad (HIT) family protein
MADADRPPDAVATVGIPCAFCEIVAERADAEVVYHDAVAVAFLDRTPLFHGHTLVVPRRHVVTLPELADDEVGPFFRRVRMVAEVLPRALDAEGTFVAANNIVSQSVAHLHVHVVPRTKGDGLRGFFWPRHRYPPGGMSAYGARLRRAFAQIELDDEP